MLSSVLSMGGGKEVGVESQESSDVLDDCVSKEDWGISVMVRRTSTIDNPFCYCGEDDIGLILLYECEDKH